MIKIKNMIVLRILIIGFALLSTFSGFVQSGSGYVINGEVIGAPYGLKLHLVRIVDNNYDTVETTQLRYGKFKFKGKLICEGEFYRIMRDSSTFKGDFIPIFLDNSEISVSVSYSRWPDAVVTGSKSHSEWITIKHVIDSLVSERQKVARIISKIDPIKDSLKFKELTNIYNVSLIQEQKNAVVDFINKNPDSYYSAFLLNGRAFSVEEKIAAFGKMTFKARNSYYGMKLTTMLGIRVGEIAHNFESNTPDGRRLSLNEIVSKNKLTLIDFWASWCVPCRNELPNIKKVYEKFHKYGFDVLGVSLDTKKEKWVSAIREECLPWENVSELKGRNETGARLYQLDGIPALLLIDGKGRIVAMDLPGSEIPSLVGSLRGNALFRKVEEALEECKE